MYQFLIKLPDKVKRSLIALLDIVLAVLAIISALALSGAFAASSGLLFTIGLFAVLSALFCQVFGLFRLKLFGFDLSAIRTIALTATATGLSALLLAVLGLVELQASVAIQFALLFFVFAIAARISALWILARIEHSRQTSTIPVAIYGAGSAGIQLAAALRYSNEIHPAVLVDDKASLHGQTIGGLTIHAPSALRRLISSGKVKRVLLAMPSISQERQVDIAEELKSWGGEVQALPSYTELIAGKSLSADWKSISPNDFLERPDVVLDLPEADNAYRGRSILITGAGGSIGSELCRQVLKFSPKQIVLYENSELALYSIEREISALVADKDIAVLPILGSVTNLQRVSEIMQQHGVQVVLHAAAFKHVPLVEANELEGLRNNVVGTHIVCQAAVQAQVEKLILISSDKAVRPTNIMGATKRLAELVVQDFDTRSASSTFSSVRFGNVLGSSGSVIPLFKSQIERGGPVTITDRRVIRYFMTTSEASQLVLLAGCYAEGGDVFVLDMGEPVKILDLAERMIRLYGSKVKTSEQDKEGILIKEVGLRPGEKLYEELLIDDNVLDTPHPKILRAQEAQLSSSEATTMLKEMDEILANADAAAARDFIRKWVKGYQG